MSEETVADLDVNSAILSIEKGADGFAAGLRARFSALSDLPGELAILRSSLVGASTSPVLLSLAIVLVVVLTAGTFLVLALQVNKWTATSAGWRRFGLSAAAMGVALTVGLVAARMLAPPGPAFANPSAMGGCDCRCLCRFISDETYIDSIATAGGPRPVLSCAGSVP